MELALVMFRPDGQRCDLAIREPVTILGRHVDCQIQIPHPNVSRRHMQIMIEGATARIKDLGSSNGTFLNDQRVQEAVLAAGDQLKISNIVFTVVIDGEPGEIVNSADETRQEATMIAEEPPSNRAAAPSPPPAAAKPPPDRPTTAPVALAPDDAPIELLEEPEDDAGEGDPLAALAAMDRQPPPAK